MQPPLSDKNITFITKSQFHANFKEIQYMSYKGDCMVMKAIDFILQ
jgi:hypothetical protein